MVKKVASLLNNKNSVRGASIILMVTLFFSNVLGVVRDHFLTQKIPTDMLSVYYAAFRIPDLIFNILILGAITSAFIPIFTLLISQEKEKEAWEVASSVINIAIIVLVVLSLVLAIIMPWLVPLFVPGFSEEKQETTAFLARLMLFSPFFFGLSYIFGGILNSFKRFLVYSLSPLVYNLIIILGTILFADKFGIVGVALSVVAGASLHFLIQLPSAIRLGFKWNLKINFQNWAVRRIGLLMLPRSIALGANQIMLLVFTAIASNIGGSAVAVYNLADNIQTMPMVVFGTSFATAIFPSLSESYSKNKMDLFSEQITKTTRTILFFLIPMTVILILLRTQIIRIILGSGHFGWSQTIDTANTLGYFALSLVFTGLIPLYARGFYALHNTRTPMIITLTNVAISIVLGKILAGHFGVEGLALGYSIGSAIGLIAMYVMLKRKIKLINGKKIFWFIIKVVVATLFMAVAIQESKTFIGIIVDMQRFWGIAIQTVSALAFGLLIYILTAWTFGLEEMNSINVLFQKYFKREVE